MEVVSFGETVTYYMNTPTISPLNASEHGKSLRLRVEIVTSFL